MTLKKAYPSKIQISSVNSIEHGTVPIWNLWKDTFDLVRLFPSGYKEGFQLYIKDSTHIIIDGGVIDIIGNLYYSTKSLDVNPITIDITEYKTPDTIFYVYINPPAGTSVITESDIIISSTSKVFNPAYGGYYNETEWSYRFIGAYCFPSLGSPLSWNENKIEIAVDSDKVPNNNDFIQYWSTYGCWVTRTIPLVDEIDEATSAHGVKVDGWTLKDGGAAVATGGTNTFNLTNGTASLDVAEGAAVDINDDVTVSKPLTVNGSFGTTLASEGQVNTITLNESLTVGGGYSGTITFSASGKTLTVAEAITLNPVAVGALLVASSANTVDDLAVGLTTQILVGGGAGTVPAWGTDLPTAVTIGGAYVYRAGGTDVAVADGGTGLSSGTSGGILGYTAAGTIASSVALTDSMIVVGGGAGATPTPLADGLGATTEYLRGNAAGEPTWETLNQAAVAGLTITDSPTFVTTKLSGLSPDTIPYNTLTPDLLDEDCSDISDWTDGDAGGAESSVDPAGQFKFDTGDGADEGNPYAQRYRVISAPPDKFTIEFKTYFDALGTIVNSDSFYMTYRSSTWWLQVIMTSDYMSIRKAGTANYTYFYGVVKCNASAAWQVWRFQVDKSAGEDDATVEVFLDGVSLGTCDCDYKLAGTNGFIQFVQNGYTTDHRILHIDYIKVATGLGEISGGLVDSIVSKYGKSVLINGGLNVGGSTDPGDDNLRVEGTGTITGGFGCNSKTAQNAYASGGALSAYSTGTYGYDTAEHAQEIHTLLVNIRAALVANGIMS